MVVVRSTAALFRTVTFAFGTVAPEGSFTNPEILPRSDCAQLPGAPKPQQSANALASSATHTIALFRIVIRIITPPQTGFRRRSAMAHW